MPPISTTGIAFIDAATDESVVTCANQVLTLGMLVPNASAFVLVSR